PTRGEDPRGPAPPGPPRHYPSAGRLSPRANHRSVRASNIMNAQHATAPAMVPTTAPPVAIVARTKKPQPIAAAAPSQESGAESPPAGPSEIPVVSEMVGACCAGVDIGPDADWDA